MWNIRGGKLDAVEIHPQRDSMWDTKNKDPRVRKSLGARITGPHDLKVSCRLQNSTFAPPPPAGFCSCFASVILPVPLFFSVRMGMFILHHCGLKTSSFLLYSSSQIRICLESQKILDWELLNMQDPKTLGDGLYIMGWPWVFWKVEVDIVVYI